MVRRQNFAHTLNCQTSRGCQHAEGNNCRRDRLGFAVTVGMRFIRRTSREFQSAPNDERARDVERGLDAIGDQDVGVAEQAAENFRRGENQVHDHAEKRDARTGLQIVDGSVRIRRRGH